MEGAEGLWREKIWGTGLRKCLKQKARPTKGPHSVKASCDLGIDCRSRGWGSGMGRAAGICPKEGPWPDPVRGQAEGSRAPPKSSEQERDMVRCAFTEDHRGFRVEDRQIVED